MFVCKNCGKNYQTPTKFCSQCGSTVTEETAATYAEPAATYAEPTAYAEPTVYAPTPSYGAAPVAPVPVRTGPSFFENKSLLGAIVSFSSAFVSFMSLILTFMAFDENYLGSSSAIFSLFATVLALLGLNLINKEETATNPIAKVGSMISFIVAMVGIGLFALSIIAYMTAIA